MRFRDVIPKWLGGRVTPPPADRGEPLAGAQEPNNPATRTVAVVHGQYPPRDAGLTIAWSAELLTANADIIQRLRVHAAMDEPMFTTRFLAPISRLAIQVGNIPAVPTGLFGSDGGLFRACLELAFFSFQSADGRIFTSNEGVERRHALEGRWRYLCFASALLYPVGGVLDRITVTGPTGTVWPKMRSPLLPWAKENQTDRIFIAWGGTHGNATDRPTPSLTAAALGAAIVGQDNLQWLEDGDVAMPRLLWEAASGANTTGPVGAVVLRIWEKVCQSEAARRPQALGHVVAGTQAGPHLMNAMRQAMEAGDLSLPREVGLIADRSGLYLLWPNAAAAIVKAATQAGWVEIPRSPPALAALLEQSRIVRAEPGGAVAMTELVTRDGEIVDGLQLVSPLALIEDFDPGRFTGTRTLAAIRANDPLAQAQDAGKAPAKPASESDIPAKPDGVPAAALKDHAVVESVPDRPVTPDLFDAPPATDGQEHATPGGSGAALMEAAPAVAGLPKATPSGAPEATPIRYADLVPKDVKDAIGKPVVVEQLGKLVHARRLSQEGKGDFKSRMTDNGLAVAMDSIAALPVREPINFVIALAEAGYVYTDPLLSGRKVHSVEIPERTKAITCVILSKQLVRLLNL